MAEQHECEFVPSEPLKLHTQGTEEAKQKIGN